MGEVIFLKLYLLKLRNNLNTYENNVYSVVKLKEVSWFKIKFFHPNISLIETFWMNLVLIMLIINSFKTSLSIFCGKKCFFLFEQKLVTL